jgi:protein-disulfide isomerase
MNMKTMITYIAIMFGVLLGVGGLLWQFGQGAEKPIADIAGTSRHTLGSGSIVVTEFSDFQCPACQAVHEPLKTILKKYEGKVTLVYRHFPLTSIHKQAQLAAQAAEAASLQNKFFEYGDILFARQQDWEGSTDPHATFIGYAKELGLDEARFATDLDSQAVKEAIAVDTLAATRYRLQGTPSFFVNGVATGFNALDAKLTELAK